MALARFKWIARRAPAPGAEARGASEGGFSLVETIIASSVMMAGVITLAQLFVMSTRTNVAAKSTSIAAVLIQLEKAGKNAVREAMVDAWLASAPQHLADEYLSAE